jgi:hypothetical protein
MEYYIYKITHNNGKNYVGQTIDINGRFLYHKRKIINKNHYNFLLNQDCDIDNYVFSIIDIANSQVTADDLEKYYIEINNSFYKKGGFNLTPGGKGSINHRTKKVYLFNLKGEFIKKYPSIRCCARELNLDASNIHRNCHGEYSKYKGYIFSFTNTIKPKKYNINSKMKKVSKYDDNGKYVESYGSIKEAALKNKIHHSASLSNAIKNKTFCCGYYWAYYTNTKDIFLEKKRCIVKEIEVFKGDIFVGIFANQKKVADYIGGSSSNINHCLNGRKKTYKGYVFKYK